MSLINDTKTQERRSSKIKKQKDIGPGASFIFNKRQLVILVAVILVVNLVLSGGMIVLGTTQYENWGPWVKSNILGQKQDLSSGNQENNLVRDILERQKEQNDNNQAGFDGGEVRILKQEDLVTEIVERASEAVVSIIVTKDLPKMEQYYEQYNPFGDGFFDQFFGDDFGFQVPRYRQNGTEKREIGGGTGFIISEDGMIITNKHVVSDEDAEYTVLTNNEEKYEAEILARDPVNDIAVLKINKIGLPKLGLGDSSNLKVGQTVIAIGNALGEYRNTVSTGVISGLQREITASSGFGQAEQLSGVIQTDAAINPGNSGGPLLNLEGDVIGVNVAVAHASENIGFSLPINDVKKVVDSVEKYGEILRPWIGVRYMMINKAIQDKNQLLFDYGALVLRGQERDDLAVIPGSPADKAGIVENDIILSVDGRKLEGGYTLSKAVLEHSVGDEIKLNVYHRGEEKEVIVKLEKRK